MTFDVDLIYSRTLENIERLAAALAPYRPYLRDAEPNLPFAWDAKTIRGGLNFALTTDLGDVDLFGEVAGSETYSECCRIRSTSRLLVYSSNVWIFRH